MPQIATVGRVDGLRHNGAIGTQEELALFRCKLRVWRVLRYSDYLNPNGIVSSVFNLLLQQLDFIRRELEQVRDPVV